MSIGHVCQFSPDPPTQLQGARRWIDLSPRVLSFDIRRGKTRMLDRFEAGTMDLRVKNTDRFLDPENAQGPYYGSLLPMRPIRFGFVVDGVTYWQFFGFVERWPQVWQGHTWAEVDMTCVDGFELLANHYLTSSYATLQQSTATSGILYASVVLGYLGNLITIAHVNTGSLSVGVVGTAITVNINAGVTTNADVAAAIAASGPASALVTASGASGIATAFAATALSGGTFAQELSGARINDLLNFVNWPFGPAAAGTAASAVIGTQSVTFSSGGGGFQSFAAVSAPVTAVAVTGGTGGNAITVTLVNVSGGGALVVGVVGSAITVTGDIYGAGAAGLAAAVAASGPASALITIQFTVGGVLDSLNSGLTMLQGGTGTAAVLAPGTVQVQAQAITSADGTTALDHAQLVELTENGAFFMARDGTVAWLDQNSLVSGVYVAAQMAFVDGESDPNNTTTFGYTDLEGSFDKDLIFNNIRATRLNGTVQIASDFDSDQSYFTRTLSIAPLSISDAAAFSLAQVLLTKYKDPYFRFEPMQLFPGKSSAFWKALCQLDLMYAVSIERHPPGVGQPYTLHGPVINIQIQGKPPIQQTVWTLQVDPNSQGQVLILTDPIFGALDAYGLGF